MTTSRSDVRRRDRATLEVRTLPHLDTDVLTVACAASATTITIVRGAGLPLSREQWITFAAYQHEESCEGSCDVSGVLDRGCQLTREATERLWEEMTLHGRRN